MEEGGEVMPRFPWQRTRDEALPTLEPVTLTPIGIVRNNVSNPDRHGWSRVRSRLVLLPDLAPALAGLEDFTHLIVVTWLDRVTDEERALLTVHPAGDPALPRRGVLALRTHHRPNPIGVSVVPVERIEATVIHVRGLDVADGTPLLDLKPYIPHYDSMPAARLPGWAEG